MGSTAESLKTDIRKYTEMGDTEHMIRLGIGSAAAAAAIFAPIDLKWKGVLTAVAAETLLTGIYRISPLKRSIPM